eukprot:254093-Chlamydomonas_euryale.AAC.1
MAGTRQRRLAPAAARPCRTLLAGRPAAGMCGVWSVRGGGEVGFSGTPSGTMRPCKSRGAAVAPMGMADAPVGMAVAPMGAAVAP